MWQSRIFQEKLFCPQNGANGPKLDQKQSFLKLLENLVINFLWVWSRKKFYNICCILAQICILGKILVPEIWAKMLSTNQIAVFLNWLYLWNKMMKKPDFFAYWCRFIEIKVWLKNNGVGVVKIVCGHSVLRTLKLAVSQKKNQ